MNGPTTRTYRFLVTIRIEGDPDTLPSVVEVAEEVATLIQNDNHGLDSSVRPIEWEDTSKTFQAWGGGE